MRASDVEALSSHRVGAPALAPSAPAHWRTPLRSIALIDCSATRRDGANKRHGSRREEPTKAGQTLTSGTSYFPHSATGRLGKWGTRRFLAAVYPAASSRGRGSSAGSPSSLRPHGAARVPDC